MSCKINEIHIDGSAYRSAGDLGIRTIIREIASNLNNATNEYVYKQMLSVNVDPKAIELHQKRIAELEKENSSIKESLETEALYSEYWKARAIEALDLIQTLKSKNEKLREGVKTDE